MVRVGTEVLDPLFDSTEGLVYTENVGCMRTVCVGSGTLVGPKEGRGRQDGGR